MKKITSQVVRRFSGVLAAVLCFAAVRPLQALEAVPTEVYPTWEEPAFSAQDIVYTNYELKDFEAAGDAFLQALALDKNKPEADPSRKVTQEEVGKAMDQLLAAYDEYNSQYSFIQYQYSQDISVQKVSDELTHMKNLHGDIFNKMLELLQIAQNNKALGSMVNTYLGERRAENLRETKSLTDKQKELNESMTALEQEFDTLSGEKTKTGKDNRRIGDIYVELVQLRNQYAQEEGYKNYQDMTTEQATGRDYTSEDLNRYYKAVKEYIAPLYLKLSLMSSYTNLNKYAYPAGQTILDVVGSHLPNISSELQESFQYMVDKKLYLLGNSENNEQVSYTISVAKAHSAMIFAYDYSPFDNIQTLIHEFGHFNTAVRSKDDSFFSQGNVDLAEIHSQGLELLFLPYYKEMYGKTAAEATYYNLLNVVWSILTGAMYNEFETYAHTEKDITVDKLNRKFRALSDEYMIPTYDKTAWQFYHMYHAPFYYLSYSVSAMASASLLHGIGEDWRGTVNKYLKLTSLGEEEYGFRATLAEAGMDDIFADGAVEAIAKAIKGFANTPLSISDLDSNSTTTGTDSETRSTIDLPEYGTEDATETETSSDNTNTADDQTSKDLQDKVWNGDGDLGISDMLKAIPSMIRYILSGDLWEDLADASVFK